MNTRRQDNHGWPPLRSKPRLATEADAAQAKIKLDPTVLEGYALQEFGGRVHIWGGCRGGWNCGDTAWICCFIPNDSGS